MRHTWCHSHSSPLGKVNIEGFEERKGQAVGVLGAGYDHGVFTKLPTLFVCGMSGVRRWQMAFSS